MKKPYKYPYLHCLSHHHGFDVNVFSFPDQYKQKTITSCKHLPMSLDSFSNADNSQGTLYLHTIHTQDSKSLLESAVTLLLQSAITTEEGTSASVPSCLYQLYYEQKSSHIKTAVSRSQHFDFPTPSVSLTFNDTVLEPVQQAWEQIMGPPPEDEDIQFMVFADREGVGDDNDLE